MNKKDLQNFHDKVDPNIGNIKSLLLKLEKQVKNSEQFSAIENMERVEDDFNPHLLIIWIDKIKKSLLRIERYQDQLTDDIANEISDYRGDDSEILLERIQSLTDTEDGAFTCSTCVEVHNEIKNR